MQKIAKYPAHCTPSRFLGGGHLLDFSLILAAHDDRRTFFSEKVVCPERGEGTFNACFNLSDGRRKGKGHAGSAWAGRMPPL